MSAKKTSLLLGTQNSFKLSPAQIITHPSISETPSFAREGNLLSYYDISLLYIRIHLKWISLCYCAKSWSQNYLRVDHTMKMIPPRIFLDPVYRSRSTKLLYYLKTYLDMKKSLRNLTLFRQHVLLLYYENKFEKVMSRISIPGQHGSNPVHMQIQDP